MNDSNSVLYHSAEDIKQPLSYHLDELRKMIIRVLIVLFVSICISYLFSGSIIKNVCDISTLSQVGLVVYSPLEWMFARLKLSCSIAIALTIPILIYETFKFASKGLYENEKRYLRKIIPFSILFFTLGFLFAYFLAMPLIFKYFLLDSNNTADAQLSVETVLSVVTTLVLGFGIAFQLPILMISAIKMKLINYNTLRKQRILVYTSLLGFAAFMSPDPTFISQVLCAIVLILLFEVGFLLSKLY